MPGPLRVVAFKDKEGPKVGDWGFCSWSTVDSGASLVRAVKGAVEVQASCVIIDCEAEISNSFDTDKMRRGAFSGAALSDFTAAKVVSSWGKGSCC